ncbi:MAG: REP-associated tyrosine transposase [Pyrinomonadaceae bacterium]
MKSTFKGRLVLSKESDSWYSRGYFPHFDGQGITQHVCFHLFDSLPQSLLAEWPEELRREEVLKARRVDCHVQRERRRRIHDALDRGYGSCLLQDNRIAEIVEDALLHFDGERYALHAWCVMPNHVHTLFTPVGQFRMSGIVHSWKSFTAHECNKVLGRSGKFWEREPFDRYIRNQRHFRNAVSYIENNPVKAGLCKEAKDWRWSSARRRGTHASGVLLR